MPIYPCLEDMKTTELIKAQMDAMQPQIQQAPQPQYSVSVPSAPPQTMARSGNPAHYPSLMEFMGLELTEEMIKLNMPEYAPQQPHAVAVPQPHSIIQKNNAGMAVMAPISGSNSAVVKSMVTHGVRRVSMNKGSGKLGLRVRTMNTGVFVCLVMDNTPASQGGLRFGDQILQINGQDMAGLNVDKVHGMLKKLNKGDSVDFVLRDRPFERTVTLVKDSNGCIGFQYKDGKIINIVKDSSASRNGLLTEHALLEVNGKNVIGLKDKDIGKIIKETQGNALTITVMPTFLFNHMVKEMANSLFGKMDHSNPDY
ncbi:unnamed protein product [Orchesella dallaii]|uniref:PDZ domain-containing protein n=1 Tax=Orchesella dallaii TaxID=48710 RepID=A0ABP1REL9_9HEXA